MLRAVILAGGEGKRLAPYTTVLPKPLMPVGERPILEILIRRLRSAGVRNVTLAVGHLASLIMAYFGDGERFGIEIDYSLEDKPLGTAGPLRLVKDLGEPFFVMNGDLLTDIDFSAMARAHQSSDALATVGVFQRDLKIDLGVVETENGRVTGYIEKPTHRFLVSMGIYVLDPSVVESIPQDRPFDLPELVTGLISSGDHVASYEHRGYWLDIGRPEDYERAQLDLETIALDL
ncbi:MAG: NDP-mannose synthase [Actinomycetota bacterium]|nr:NDP-mannose synthase [Actinomycetota bacterium]